MTIDGTAKSYDVTNSRGAASVAPKTAVTTERLIGLDLLRGIAALVVLFYHSDFGFGLRGELLPGGFLAVDLFFVLSGFVLSLNYGEAIARRTITWKTYIVARLARLYPLFLITTAAGLPVVLARQQSSGQSIEIIPTALAALLNSLMLPGSIYSGGGGALFPFNAASWSIFFEMIMSVLFFVFLARMSTGRLAALTGALFAGLVFAVWTFGTVDIGYAWKNIWGGFPRAGFTFCAGILLHRIWQIRSWSVSPAALTLTIAAMLLCVQLLGQIPLAWRGFAEVALVLLLFIPVAACAAGVRGLGRATSFATFVGDTSYAVYLTQTPLILLTAGISRAVFDERLPALAPWSGIAIITVVVSVSYVSQHWFESPARKAIRRAFA